eukprot:364542-Chlamydomonas_euryale.AAC.4
MCSKYGMRIVVKGGTSSTSKNLSAHRPAFQWPIHKWGQMTGLLVKFDLTGLLVNLDLVNEGAGTPPPTRPSTFSMSITTRKTSAQLLGRRRCNMMIHTSRI